MKSNQPEEITVHYVIMPMQYAEIFKGFLDEKRKVYYTWIF